MDKFTYTGNGDPAAIDALYQSFLADPNSVDESWRKFFEGIEFAQKHFPQNPEFLTGGPAAAPAKGSENFPKEFKVINLIEAYRTRGHLFTKTNPVRQRRHWGPTLDIENFGLAQSDLELEFEAGKEVGIGKAKLKDIIKHLDAVYRDTIGFEFMYIRIPEQVEFIKSRIDVLKNGPGFSAEEKKHIYAKLSRAVQFEKYLGKKFVGQKRFSLEGGESLIPALNTILEKGSDDGVEAFFVGMAHRGRLNVLANIFEKPFEDIFVEFEGYEYADENLDGDVKYHLGFNHKVTTKEGNEVLMNLLPNPSHLETVDPLTEGLARAFAEREFNGDLSKVCPILIHGDAAVAGQGVVYEVIQMQGLDGYKTGGTIHIVINNQVGFTTNFTEGRSSIYCTDVAKTTLSPVFHVNGDDPEALVFAVKLAMEFRKKFQKDVFIDLLCYRKYGHNEGDEPRFTQPLLYKAIDKHLDPATIYGKKLLDEKVIDDAFVKAGEDEFTAILDANLDRAKGRNQAEMGLFLSRIWGDKRKATVEDFESSPDTGYDFDALKEIANKIVNLPEGMNFLKKIRKIFEDRSNMVNETDKLDWAMGELLAYATLLAEGHPVRLSGQDVARGTFSHRHAIVKAEDSEAEYAPLNNLGVSQSKFAVYNSLLSEYAVMGFDYGYALGMPDGLTLWEAQFGDFVNGAQIIIDQYLTAAEDKWNNQNGLVLLLPHGYEGQGAEHSSARWERFLQQCAELNIQVVNCTTPANMFHVLRRQLKRPFRKPLVIMTPKSLLRHPKCVSSLADLADGRFQEVFDDTTANPEEVEKVIFCSGKIYYELLERRDLVGDTKTAIVRLEQLYPFPMNQIVDVRDKYVKAVKWNWVQEEPENMGAWWYIRGRFMHKALRDLDLEVISQPASASPATGSYKKAAKRQQDILNRAIGPIPVKEEVQTN
jgi:2-oxoglutarate dehydrogenase E1 component